ncbi:MAG TPA: PAS domain S-box protein [Gaiellaceae bacterium]|nr:PAS domain S-box protein [Gaiellaceae bacterium]
MARGAVYLYAFGAALACASLAFPSGGRDAWGIVGIAVAALAGAAFHCLVFDRLPVVGFQLSGAAGTALVTLAAVLGGEGGGAYAFFYLWVVLYAFFFYDVAAATVQLGLVAGAHIAVLQLPGVTPFTPVHTLVQTGSLAMAGLIVLVLKTHIASLVDGLRGSEHKYRTLVEQLPLVTYVRGLDVLDSNSYASPQVEALFGYTQEEWETNNGLLERVIHPDDRGRALAAAAQLRETGHPMRLEYRFVARDGRIVWVYDETHLVRDGDGRPAGVRGFLLDITERKEAEQALGEGEERFHAMVANVPGAIFRCAYDDDWTMEFVSDAIEQISGYPASDFIGNRVRSFASVIHPGDQQSLAPSVAECRPYEIEYRIVHASGDVRWVLERGQAARGPDGEVRIDGAIFDVSETRRAAQALLETKAYSETLIRTANVMIVGLDPDGRVRVFNEAAEKITGYAGAELEGEDWFEVLVPRDRYPEAWADFVRWRQGGELPEDFESPIVTKTGEERLISWRNSLVGQGDRVVGSISFGIDITAGKQLEEQLRQSQKMEAVGRLAGGIAHDFNNILLAITGYSDFALARLGEDGPAADDVREIQKAADRATGLTRQLLAFSRKQVLQPQLVDLNDVVTDLQGMLRRLIGDHIELEVELEDGVGQVLVDRGQIEQVLMNLALNARDAMPAGGTLSLATQRLELSGAPDERLLGVQPGPHALLVVGDTGLGMDEQTRSRAFEPFFTTKEPGKGTGLGLSTVYGIVQQSGGSISLDSAPANGTVVRIFLPLPQSLREAPTVLGADLDRPAGSETILLAEDEEVVRDLVQEILEGAGYTVLAAADGREALSLSKAHAGDVDLMVTDVVMPGMSGRELAERLWLSRPEMKVLYISGYTDIAVFDPGVLDPGSAFLQKPFSSAELTQKVREVLDAPRAGLAA